MVRDGHSANKCKCRHVCKIVHCNNIIWMNAKSDSGNAYEYICKLIKQSANEHTYRMRCNGLARSQSYALRLNWTIDNDKIL